MGSIKDSPSNQTISDICDDLFSLVVYLREAADVENPEVLYDRATELFITMEEKARQSKIPDVDINDAKYALVAIIDETVGWASRLEQKFFSRNVAGEEFFNRLDEIKTAKVRNDVLKVYYLCLTLGFEGRHFRSPERIQEYISELQEILELKGAARLSPRGERGQDAGKGRGKKFGILLPWIISASGVAAFIVVIVLFRIRISHWASVTIDKIQGFLS